MPKSSMRVGSLVPLYYPNAQQRHKEGIQKILKEGPRSLVGKVPLLCVRTVSPLTTQQGGLRHTQTDETLIPHLQVQEH